MATELDSPTIGRGFDWGSFYAQEPLEPLDPFSPSAFGLLLFGEPDAESARALLGVGGVIGALTFADIGGTIAIDQLPPGSLVTVDDIGANALYFFDEITGLPRLINAVEAASFVGTALTFDQIGGTISIAQFPAGTVVSVDDVGEDALYFFDESTFTPKLITSAQAADFVGLTGLTFDSIGGTISLSQFPAGSVATLDSIDEDGVYFFDNTLFLPKLINAVDLATFVGLGDLTFDQIGGTINLDQFPAGSVATLVPIDEDALYFFDDTTQTPKLIGQADALAFLLPNQTGQDGNFLQTNAGVLSWAATAGGGGTVLTTTDQTIDGQKTFFKTIVVGENTETTFGGAPPAGEVLMAFTNEALDSEDSAELQIGSFPDASFSNGTYIELKTYSSTAGNAQVNAIYQNASNVQTNFVGLSAGSDVAAISVFGNPEQSAKLLILGTVDQTTGAYTTLASCDKAGNFTATSFTDASHVLSIDPDARKLYDASANEVIAYNGFIEFFAGLAQVGFVDLGAGNRGIVSSKYGQYDRILTLTGDGNFNIDLLNRNLLASDGTTVTFDYSSVVNARTSLGLVIGTNVQAWDADLDTLAGLTATTNNFIVSVASAWASRTPTQVKSTLAIANTDVSGLGTASTLASDTDGTLATNSDSRIATQKAVKTYIDGINTSLLAAIAALDSKDEVAYCSTSALPTCTYSNGTLGVGATLTATTNGPLIIDGVTTVLGAQGSGILVAGQASDFQNGWYTLTQQGVVAVSPWIMTRRTPDDQAAEIGPGYLTAVEAPTGLTAGSNNQRVFLSIAPTPFVVGTDSLTFAMVGGTYTAGNGLSLSGTAFSINTSITADLSTAQSLTNKKLGSLTSNGFVKTGSGDGTLSVDTATYQPLDSDLTTLAGLTATTDNFIVSVSSAWASRTPAQVRSTLGLVIGTNVAASGTNSDITALTALAGTSTVTLAIAANTTSTGLWLTDTTPASSGNQQYSPSLQLSGRGWKTDATAASQPVDFRSYVIPVQGTANPSGYLTIDSAINNGSFGNAFNFFSSGGLSIGSTTDAGAGKLLLSGLTASAFIETDANKILVSKTAAQMRTDLALVIGTNVQAWDADLDTWAGITPATGIGTFLATPTSANLLAAMTDETGTGACVFANTPTLVTPALGAATGTSLVLSSFLNEAKGADIASATTTDIGAATGNYVVVTGTVTITGLGTVQAGTRRIVKFSGALTLTHNATSLILPGSANITTVAGDVATFVSLGSGNWICVGYDQVTWTGSGSKVFATSPTFVTPVLGTPTSGTLTSCTGLPIAGLTASTSTALGVGSVELGHASDTTLARVSAGVFSVEGITVPNVNNLASSGSGVAPTFVAVGVPVVAVLTGANLKSNATLDIFTVPTSRTFVVFSSLVIITAVTSGAAVAFAYQIRDSTSSNGLTAGAAAASAAPTVGKTLSQIPAAASGPWVSVAAAAKVQIAITTGYTTSTAVTGDVFILGTYVA